jgi:hypothetical protein
MLEGLRYELALCRLAIGSSTLPSALLLTRCIDSQTLSQQGFSAARQLIL